MEQWVSQEQLALLVNSLPSTHTRDTVRKFVLHVSEHQSIPIEINDIPRINRTLAAALIARLYSVLGSDIKSPRAVGYISGLIANPVQRLSGADPAETHACLSLALSYDDADENVAADRFALVASAALYTLTDSSDHLFSDFDGFVESVTAKS